MRITSVNEVEQVRSLLESHFGEVPENFIIESEEVIKECKHHSGYMYSHLQAWNMRVCGVRVAEQVAEIQTG
jgi:hypothetical protein